MSSLRRLFDLAGATAGLLVFAPVMIVVAAAVLIDDGRPVLFRQTRLGYRRRPFAILKFRSMRDGRITRIGRLLRATGLDEIPQFINILRGDMSAVGPRPLTEADVQRFGWTGTAFDFRWETQPGAHRRCADRRRLVARGGARARPRVRRSLETAARLSVDRAVVRRERSRQVARAVWATAVKSACRVRSRVQELYHKDMKRTKTA